MRTAMAKKTTVVSALDRTIHRAVVNRMRRAVMARVSVCHARLMLNAHLSPEGAALVTMGLVLARQSHSNVLPVNSHLCLPRRLAL